MKMGDLLELHGALRTHRKYLTKQDKSEYSRDYLEKLRELASERVIEMELKQRDYRYSKCYSLFVSTYHLNKFIVEEIDHILKLL